MKRSSLGNRRSIFIWRAPAVADRPCLSPAVAGLPRSRLRNAIGPLAAPSMLNLPMRVSFMTGAALMAQTIASQASRRARSASSTGRK